MDLETIIQSYRRKNDHKRLQENSRNYHTATSSTKNTTARDSNGTKIPLKQLTGRYSDWYIGNIKHDETAYRRKGPQKKSLP